MGNRRIYATRFAALAFGIILGGFPGWAAAGVYAGHQPVAGDFNGDGWVDFISQPLAGSHGVGEFIAYPDGNFGAPLATWPDKHGGTDWNAEAHRIVVGDFNGDGRDDLILQGAAGLASQEYLAAPDGTFPKLTHTLPATLGKLDSSQASHALVVGDFNGDGRADLLLQANTFVGAEAIALAGKDGAFTALAASWNDGALGMSWSADHATLAAGDFDGDGRAEILVRAMAAGGADTCCRIVAFGPKLQPQDIRQSWPANWLGVDWRPGASHVVIADLNGDGRADLLVQPRAPGGDVEVLLATKGGTFKAIADKWSSDKDGVDWSGESYRLVPEKAASGKGATLAMIPRQAGLSYRRARFDVRGHLAGVTTLTSPPPDALAAAEEEDDDGGNSGLGDLGAIAQTAGVESNSATSGNTVGAMAGKASVSQGAAGYSIPIAVPPGRAGMTPSLALSYASNGGDGHEGVGWSLGGLSAIYRCPATWTSDGYTAGTTFTYKDRFCLDGQKLKLASGSYGHSGSTYHAEVNGFGLVTANGSSGSGPASFTVKTAGGNTLTYSAMLSNSGGGFTWALTQSRDPDGNEVRYQYTTTGSEYYPKEIDYTLGHGGTTRKILFKWESRSAAGATNIVHYLAGMKLRTTQLLTHIRTYVGGEEVRGYSLFYSKSPATHRPLLHQVQVCAYDGAGQHCFKPATFTYQGQHALAFSPMTSAALSALGLVTPRNCPLLHTYSGGFSWNAMRDMNGDGRMDLVTFYGLSDAQGHPGGGMGIEAHFAQPGNKFTAPPMTQELTVPDGHSLLTLPGDIDFNLDGRTDTLIGEWNGDLFAGLKILYTTASNPQSFQVYGTGIALPSDTSGVTPHVADINGDGKPDLILDLTRGKVDNSLSDLSYEWRIYLASGSGNNTTWVLDQTLSNTKDYAFIKTLDYDGDGRQGVLIHKENSTQYTLLHSTRSGSGAITLVPEQTGIPYLKLGHAPPGVPYFNPVVSPTIADVNGDSLPDIVEPNKTSSNTWHWMIYLNEGNSNGQFGGPIDTDKTIDPELSPFVKVVHGPDGRDDLLMPTALAFKTPDLGRPPVCRPTLTGCDRGAPWDGDECKGSWDWQDAPISAYGYDWSLYRAGRTTNGTPSFVNEGVVAHDITPGDFMIDFNNDGLSDILGNDPHPSQPNALRGYRMSFGGGANGGPAPDLLTKVDNEGFGVIHQFTYKPLTSSVYTRGSGSAYPNMLFASPMQVVATMTATNPKEGNDTYDYHYADARYNVAGRGFLGFGEITVKNGARGTTTVTDYDQHFPYIGQATQSKTYKTGASQPFGSVINSWTDAVSGSGTNKYYRTYASESVSARYNPGDHSTLATTTTDTHSVDACGKPGTVKRTVTTPQATEVTQTQSSWDDPNVAECWKDTLGSQTVTTQVNYPAVSANGTPATSDKLAVTTNYTYNGNEHLIEEKATSNHGGVSAARDETYGYDGYGNRNLVKQSGKNATGNMASRTTTSDYSYYSGYFPRTVTNALNQTTTFGYAPATGNKTSATDPNGIANTFAFDAFGRSTGGVPAGESPVGIAYRNTSTEVCPAHTAYVVLRTQAGYPTSYACKDAFGNTLRAAKQGFAGSDHVYVDSVYGVLGRLTKKSAPYYPGDSIYYTQYSYDVLDRVLTKKIPTGAGTRTVTMSYSGLTVSYTDVAGGVTHQYKHTYDGLGKGAGNLVEVDQENDGKWLMATYRYDAGANLIRATDPKGNAVRAIYDGFGDKLTLQDPDKGNWSYGYNGFGEQVKSTDALKHTIRTTYDALGRKQTETDNADYRVSTWTYDTAENGIGKLAAATVAHSAGSPPFYTKLYSYDLAGRATENEIKTEGQSYFSRTGYDADGRPTHHSYPALNGGSNHTPTLSAAASPAGPVAPNTSVALKAEGRDVDGAWTLSYHWRQTGGSAVRIADPDAPTAHITPTRAGTYKFTVTASDGTTDKQATVTLEVKSLPARGARPTVSATVSHTGSFSVSWSPIAGATSYALKEEGGPGDPIYYTLGGRSKQVTGRAVGAYTFRVKGCNAVGCGVLSNASATVHVESPPPPSAPIVGPNPSHNGSYTVSWGTVSDATSYQLQESANGGAWTPKYSGSGHSKAFSGQSIGSYRYRVRAYNRVTGYGAWSAIKSETVSAPAVPGGLRANPNPSHNGAWSVSWNGAAGAGSYRLQESANGASWTLKYNSTGHSWSTSNRANGSYRYRVRAYNRVTGYSAWSAIASETVLLPPASAPTLSAPGVVTIGDTYRVSWGAVATTTNYELEAGADSSFSGASPLSEGTALSASETAQTAVYYRVRACNGAGCSGWSNVVLVTAKAAPIGCPRPPCCGIVIGGCDPRSRGEAAVSPAAGQGSAGALVVITAYNVRGYPESLTRMSDGHTYVTVNAMDAYGHASALTEGNGARVMRAYDQATGLALQTQASSRAHGLIAGLTTAWDGFGNLKARTATDPATHITRTERAGYDDLNRLKQTVLTLEDGGRRTLTFAYGDNGNRTQKCVNGRCTTYGYGGSAGPHALTSVNGAGNYAYDANGAMLHDGDKTLAWSAFGKAMYIGTQQGGVGFAYGPDRARYQKRVNSAYGEAETVTYLQGAERLQFANGQACIRRTLAFAGVTVIDTGGVGAKVLYAVKDHLGSTMALSDASGSLVQQMSYSPFGKRLGAAWAQGMDTSTAWQINTTETDKGYTGQEELDAVALVNYNARLYDPALGRFLSTDPLIGHPGSTQSINPYSYVENNPLNKTDPTGEASTCTGSGSNKVCTVTVTPTGSHIPQTTKVTQGANGHAVTSGPGAMPGGRIATSMDGNSSMSVSFVHTKAANSTGNTNVSTHRISNKKPGDSATGDGPQDMSAVGGPKVAANDNYGGYYGLSAKDAKAIANSAAFKNGESEGMAAAKMDAQDLQARDAASGPIHLTQAQYNLIQANNFWARVGTDAAMYSTFLAAPESGALRVPAAGLEWSAAHGAELGRACLLCGSLMTHQPNLMSPIHASHVYGPTMDMVNDIRRWSMRQWQILTRTLPGGD